ncbi:MAG: 2-phospho-L-lactate transferase CofD family protein, partial [Candidatus Omnitrophota bacterium]|nr:2-phospho-L-lactate transferase CofD family protein [Candidatus Omnitrophota bacterium]
TELIVHMSHDQVGKKSISELLKYSQRFAKDRKNDSRKKAVLISGGTATGTLWGTVLRMIPALQHADMVGVVGNVDDGGSSYTIVNTLNRAGFGIIPPPGDQINTLQGRMTSDKREHIMGDSGRLPADNVPAKFVEAIFEVVRRTLNDTENVTVIEPDFFYFVRMLIEAARHVDELNDQIRAVNQSRTAGEKVAELPVRQVSIRNIYLLGFLKEFGLLNNPSDAKINRPAVDTAEEQAAYEQAAKAMARAAGVHEMYVTVSSFDPKTEYVRYRDYTLLYRVVDLNAVRKVISDNIEEAADMEEAAQAALLTYLSRMIEPDYKKVAEVLAKFGLKKDDDTLKVIARMLPDHSIRTVVFGLVQTGDGARMRVLSPETGSVQYAEEWQTVVLDQLDKNYPTDLLPVAVSLIHGKLHLVVGRDLYRVEDSDINNIRLLQIEREGKEETKVTAEIGLAADGTGRAKLYEGKSGVEDIQPLFEVAASNVSLQMYLRSTLVKMQTNITETINFSKIEEAGFLERGLGLKGRVPAMPVRQLPNEKVLEEILSAKKGDIIIVGPGSFYTSILPHFMVDGLASALHRAKSRGVTVIMLMNGTYDNETLNYKPAELIDVLTEAVGMSLDSAFDYVMAGDSESEEVMYARSRNPAKFKETLHPVVHPEIRTDMGAASVSAKKNRGALIYREADVAEVAAKWPEVKVYLIKQALALLEVQKRTGGRDYRVLYDVKKIAEAVQDVHSQDQTTHPYSQTAVPVEKHQAAVTKFGTKDIATVEVTVNGEKVTIEPQSGALEAGWEGQIKDRVLSLVKASRAPPAFSVPQAFTVIVTTKTGKGRLVASPTGAPYVAASHIPSSSVLFHPYYFDTQVSTAKRLEIFYHELISHITHNEADESRAMADTQEFMTNMFEAEAVRVAKGKATRTGASAALARRFGPINDRKEKEKGGVLNANPESATGSENFIRRDDSSLPYVELTDPANKFSGRGFIFAEDQENYFIITAGHVVFGIKELVVKFGSRHGIPDGRAFCLIEPREMPSNNLWGEDHKKDFAILVMPKKTNMPRISPLSLALDFSGETIAFLNLAQLGTLAQIASPDSAIIMAKQPSGLFGNGSLAGFSGAPIVVLFDDGILRVIGIHHGSTPW